MGSVFVFPTVLAKTVVPPIVPVNSARMVLLPRPTTPVPTWPTTSATLRRSVNVFELALPLVLCVETMVAAVVVVLVPLRTTSATRVLACVYPTALAKSVVYPMVVVVVVETAPLAPSAMLARSVSVKPIALANSVTAPTV